MRELGSYSLRDWLLFQPAIRAFKEVRDAAIRDAYCAIKPRRLGVFLQEHQDVRGSTLAVVIAYEQPWLIDTFIRRFRQFVTGAQLLIADNSRNRERRAEIAAVCGKHGVMYFPLPWNPVRNINRSHGNAVNWCYRNLIKPLQPEIFALLDHDIFPTATVDFKALLGDQPFYGHKIDRGAGWALWAGYSFFRLAAVADARPDFNPDMDRRLVTGGRNYSRIYRYFDPAVLRFASWRLERLANAEGAKLFSETIDGWIHIGGASYANDKKAARAFYEKLLSQNSLESARLAPKPKERMK